MAALPALLSWLAAVPSRRDCRGWAWSRRSGGAFSCPHL